MSDGGERDAGFDEWLDAVESGDGYFLACPDGHGSLPPRRICPDCGDRELAERPLSDVGSIETYTVVHVATPRFAEDAPYVTAVADFDPVELTGVVRGVDPDEIEIGLTVEPVVEATETDGDRVLVLRSATAE